MKPTFITDEASQEPAVFLKLVEEFNLRGIELRSVLARPVADLGPAERTELRRLLRGSGLTVCCISSSVFKCELEERLSEFDKLRRTLDVADFFGAPLIRIFSFWRRPDRQRYGSEIIDALHQAGEAANGSAIRLGVENGKRTMHSTGAEMAELLEHLDPAVFCCVWDPANSIFGGSDLHPVAAGYPLVAPRVAHVHVKDPKLHPDGSRSYVPLGQGDLPLLEQIDRLSKDGFSGFLSLETHWRARRVIPDTELDRPGGDLFSEGGYSATEASLGVLTTALARETSRGAPA